MQSQSYFYILTINMWRPKLLIYIYFKYIYKYYICVYIYTHIHIHTHTHTHTHTHIYIGFPVGSDNKESRCNTEDLGLILGSRRSPGEGNGYPLQFSCLENSID